VRGRVGELEGPGHVARRIDVGVDGLQILVGLHGAVHGNAEFLQAVARQARHPAHGADQCVEFDPLLGARVFDDDELLLALALAAQRLVAGQHLHAVGLQRFERQLGDVRVFAQQDAWRHFHLGHLRAQALEALRQLAADGAAAQHHHAGVAPRRASQRRPKGCRW
jgi:hypothetical protein